MISQEDGHYQARATLVRIVDDQTAIQEAVADLLASVGLRSRGYSSAAEFLRDDDPNVPGCIVLDVRMPDKSGFDLLTDLAQRNNGLPVVFVTGHGAISIAVRAMKAGAVDFLTKPFDDQQLIDAVNAANRLDAARRAGAAPVLAARRRLASLSEGERDVLVFTIRGLKVKQIAAELGISEITVKVRRARILQKMEVSSAADLVRMFDLAVRDGDQP